MNKISISLLLAVFYCSIGFSSDPVWSVKLQTNVSWQKVTPLGQVIVSTGKGLVGLDPLTGKEQWNITELKNCPESSYLPVSNSPFIEVTSDNAVYFVDPVNGKIVFNSKAAGIEKVTDRYFLYQSGKVLVIGSSPGGKNSVMVMSDMSNGSVLWNKSGAYSFTTGVKDLGNNEVLITSAFFASKLNASTGDEIWKNALDPRTKGMSSLMAMLEGPLSKKLTKEEIMAQLITSEFAPDIFMIAAQKKNESSKTDSKGQTTVTITYSSVYMAFDIKTGDHKWDAAKEMRFPLGISYPTEKGLLICSASDGNINILSYSDGSGMLGKKGGGLRVKGSASGMAPMDNGNIIIVAGGGKTSTVDILNSQSGELMFDKAAKIKGSVSYTEIFPEGILIGTDQEVNFLDQNSGTWLMDNALEGGAGLITADNDYSYVFNTKDKLLYVKKNGESAYKQLSSSPLEFDGKEDPTAVEVLNGTIIVSSEQNIAAIDKTSGAVKFNKYFAAPGQSGMKKALLIASAVRAAYYTAAYATYSAAFGAASQSIEVRDRQSKATKDVTGAISQAFGDAAVTGSAYTASYIKMASQRFKATTSANEYMLIMTSVNKKETKLVQVSKISGETVATIDLGTDKEPVYDVDLVDNRLYYLKAGAEINCYNLK